MAETKIELELKWENGKFFEFTCKENDGEPIVIAHHEENACIDKLWVHIQAAALTAMAHLMTRIGKEMKAP